MAIRTGNKKLVKLLLKKLTSFKKCLAIAIRTGNIDLADQILTQAKDPAIEMLDREKVLEYTKGEKIASLFSTILYSDDYLENCSEQQIANIKIVKEKVLDIVNLLLKHSTDVKPEDLTDMLHTALYKNRIDIVKYLLKKGFKPSFSTWMSSLMYHEKAVSDLLLKYGALDEVKPGSKGNYVFDAANCEDNGEALRLVLARGVDINEGKRTALHQAADQGYTMAVRKLLDHGADPNVSSSDGDTPLIRAITDYNMNPLIVRDLIECGADVNYAWQKGITVFQAAAARCSSDIVEDMIRRGAEINAENDFNCTALMGAVYADKLDNLEMLIKHGAEVNASSKEGWTAYLLAKLFSREHIAAYLAEHGASCCAEGLSISDRFIYDAATGDRVAVAHAIKNGVDVNYCPEIFGSTALSVAVRANDPAMVKLLLELGASNIRGRMRETPLRLAKKLNYNHIFNLIYVRFPNDVGPEYLLR